MKIGNAELKLGFAPFINALLRQGGACPSSPGNHQLGMSATSGPSDSLPSLASLASLPFEISNFRFPIRMLPSPFQHLSFSAFQLFSPPFLPSFPFPHQPCAWRPPPRPNPHFAALSKFLVQYIPIQKQQRVECLVLRGSRHVRSGYRLSAISHHSHASHFSVSAFQVFSFFPHAFPFSI
jgi:hypothetical protein